MYPFSSAGILDQAINPFGAMGGIVAQKKPATEPFMGGSAANRILSNPQLVQAFGRMGSAMSAAGNSGQPFGAALNVGMSAFNEDVAGAEARQLELETARAQIERAQAEAKKATAESTYGVRSSGFEGDIARAMVVLKNPDSSPEDKAIAQGVIDTAARMQGQFDPVNGSYVWNPKARFEQGGQPLPQMPQPDLPPPSIQPTSTLLPPPAAGQTPDQSLFQPTGNRKIDAALQQKAAELQIQGQQEKMVELPKVKEQADYMMGLIDQALSHPGLPESVGGPGGMVGRQAQSFPVSEGQRGFSTIAAQLRGNTFLQAYERLKGGGAITEIEGQKAEAAIARLQQYQSEADFKAALTELRGVVSKGLERATSSATMSPSAQTEAIQDAPKVDRKALIERLRAR